MTIIGDYTLQSPDNYYKREVTAVNISIHRHS